MLTEADILDGLPALRRYARKLTHAWAKRARYHGSDARAWLFTIMHNVHVSKIRRISIQWSAVNVYAPAETGSLVDAAAFFRLVVRDVARELQAMPEGMRQAVVLAAVSIDGYDGMAARLKVDPGTFRSRLSRGRQRLRRKFASAAVG